MHGTQARGAQNSSAVHGTHVREASSVHRTHPLCTELPVTRPLCTELVNGAQKSSSVHRTRPLSTELIHCAQNSSDVHGTSVVHRTHPMCTELVRTVHGTNRTRPRCTELIRCARNSSVLHRTNDCCAQNSLEPTFAVHQPACSPLCTVRCRRTPCPGCSGPPGPARTLAHCACTAVHSP